MATPKTNRVTLYREAFEKVKPRPSGVVWSEERQDYEIASFTPLWGGKSNAEKALAEAYISAWQGWLSACLLHARTGALNELTGRPTLPRGWQVDILQDLADGLEQYPASVNVGETVLEGVDEHVESTTAAAARFIRDSLDSLSFQPKTEPPHEPR